MNVTRRAGIWTKIETKKKERGSIENYLTVTNLPKPQVLLRCKPFKEKPEENRGNELSFHQTKAHDGWPNGVSQVAAPKQCSVLWKQTSVNTRRFTFFLRTFSCEKRMEWCALEMHMNLFFVSYTFKGCMYFWKNTLACGVCCHQGVLGSCSFILKDWIFALGG